MRRARRLLVAALALFAAGVGLGAYIATTAILRDGGAYGARLIAVGATLHNAATPPVWDVSVGTATTMRVNETTTKRGGTR